MGAKITMPIRSRASVTLAAIMLLLSVSCKTETEGATAAKDLASTSANLQAYYSDLSTQVTNIIQLAYLDEAVNGSSFSPAAQTALSGTREELNKRAAVAQTLSKLAATYAALAGSTAGTDASTAASKLGTELQTDLTSLKVLPTAPKAGAPAPSPAVAAEGAVGAALPATLSEAAKLALTFAQSKDLKTGAKLIQTTVEGLEEMFASEAPLYEWIAQDHIYTAARLAEKLINQNHSDLNPMFAPAFQPFGFTAKQNLAGDQYIKAAVSEVEEQVIDQIAAFKLKTSGISKSLQTADADLTTVITGKKAKSS